MLSIFVKGQVMCPYSGKILMDNLNKIQVDKK